MEVPVTGSGVGYLPHVRCYASWRAVEIVDGDIQTPLSRTITLNGRPVGFDINHQHLFLLSDDSSIYLELSEANNTRVHLRE